MIRNRTYYSTFVVGLTLVFLISSSFTNGHSRAVASDVDLPDIKISRNSVKPKSQRDAIVILSGMGDNRKRRKIQKKFFCESYDQDVFIPAYTDRSSYANTVANFHDFMEKEEIDSFRSVHFFCYILGSWILNEYLTEHEIPNMVSVVYDRSPIQERAPDVVMQEIPLIAQMAKGRILKDMVGMRYSPVELQNCKVGIITENKATKLMRHFKDETLGMGALDWDHPETGQHHNDMMYVFLNHDEMYERFDVFGASLLYFMENGKFPEDSRRHPFKKDPFRKE